jgi:hypothetical protein
VRPGQPSAIQYYLREDLSRLATEPAFRTYLLQGRRMIKSEVVKFLVNDGFATRATAYQLWDEVLTLVTESSQLPSCKKVGCPYRKLNLAGNRYRIGRCSCLMREVCSLVVR